MKIQSKYHAKISYSGTIGFDVYAFNEGDAEKIVLEMIDSLDDKKFLKWSGLRQTDAEITNIEEI